MVNKKVKIRLRAEVVKRPEGGYKLEFRSPQYYQAEVQRFKDDRYVIVTIENERVTRSGRQNRYWHGVCFPIIAEMTGYTQEEAKEICVQKFILPRIIEFQGKEVEMRKGTSDLSKSEGVEFTDSVRDLSVELGGYIPTPCEAGYMCDKPDCQICR